MFLKGKGLRSRTRRIWIGLVKRLFRVQNVAPHKTSITEEWISRNPQAASFVSVYPSSIRKEAPPIIANYRVTSRFSRYYTRTTPPAFVAAIKNGRVYGRDTNFILTPDNHLLSDLSREFGAYGGKRMEDSSLITEQLKLPPCKRLNGKVAVITSSGNWNFHHWNYDAMPRLHLLKKAGLFGKMDYFLINHTNLPFQQQSLELLGVPQHKIISPVKTGDFYFEAEELFVPSLPSPLGTVSPWVIDFLRDLYNPANEKRQENELIYISRKNVKTRKIVNNEAFQQLLAENGFVEIFPEDYTVSAFAKVLAGARFIVSVHGSGLSNLCFISPGTTVIDILAPYHQDAYYWMMTNLGSSKYIGFFGEGEHPPDDFDLVKRKIDDDVLLDLSKFNAVLNRELNANETIGIKKT